MPLTNTLETARRIEALGFTHQQPQGFAELFEDTAHATQQDLKDFIREQMGALESRLQDQFAELRVEFHSSLRDLTWKSMAILIAAISLAVAIIKLFPNAH